MVNLIWGTPQPKATEEIKFFKYQLALGGSYIKPLGASHYILNIFFYQPALGFVLYQLTLGLFYQLALGRFPTS